MTWLESSSFGLQDFAGESVIQTNGHLSGQLLPMKSWLTAASDHSSTGYGSAAVTAVSGKGKAATLVAALFGKLLVLAVLFEPGKVVFALH